MNSELSKECPGKIDLQTRHASDLASENQSLRVLQSNRTLVSMTILNLYNDKRGSTSLNDDCAKRFLKRAWSREQSLWSDHLLPGTLWLNPLLNLKEAMIIFYRSHQGTYHRSREHGIHLARPILGFFCLSPQRNIPPIPRTWYTPGSTLTFFY